MASGLNQHQSVKTSDQGKPVPPLARFAVAARERRKWMRFLRWHSRQADSLGSVTTDRLPHETIQYLWGGSYGSRII